MPNANRIGGVMVSMLASSVVDHGFESWSCQTKEYKIDTCVFDLLVTEFNVHYIKIDTPVHR